MRGLASADGTVPCEALTTGPEDDSEAWWKRFQASVVEDARDRGLSRGRWSRWMLAVLGATALVPAVLAAAALVTLPPEEGTTEEENPVGAFIGATAIAWFPLMALPRKLRAERDTPAGREAAARWLGLREHLDATGGFAEAPPAAVAIWDRFLSYGAALGVAGGAVRALPLGSESDTEAWTAHGGHWRVVHIDYPKRLPPGWGKPPLLATAIGLAGLLGGLFVARIFFPLMADTVSDLVDSTRDEGFSPINLLAIAILALPTIVPAILIVRSALMLAAAVPDLFVTREVAGRRPAHPPPREGLLPGRRRGRRHQGPGLDRGSDAPQQRRPQPGPAGLGDGQPPPGLRVPAVPNPGRRSAALMYLGPALHRGRGNGASSP